MRGGIAGVVAGLAARVASLLGARVMRGIARVNKYVTNPLQRPWAHRLPFMAVIEHTGRRSARAYRTPVMAFVADGRISVMLNYGVDSDWVRNVRAAGVAGVVHRGRRYRLSDPRVVPADSRDLPDAVRKAGGGARSALVAAVRPEGAVPSS